MRKRRWKQLRKLEVRTMRVMKERFLICFSFLLMAVMLCADPVSAANVTVAVGGTKTLTASNPSTSYAPSGSVSYTYQWSSTDTSIAAISGSGQSRTITGRKAGTATIECKVSMSYKSYDARLKTYISRYEEGSGGAWKVTVSADGSGTGDETGEVTWSFDQSTGTLTISGSGAMEDYTNSDDAPWYQYQYKIKKVIVRYGITHIGDRAFCGCSNLTGVTIPSSVTSIGDSAFYSCSSLTGVTIPSSVTSIGDSAFYSCSSLTEVTIPSSVTSIGNLAFGYCSSLTEVTIPSGVTSIGRGAFCACARLNKIEVDKANTVYTSKDGILYNKDENILICYPGGKEGSADIPSSVTSIGDSAFYYCSSLTEVTIPSSVTSIGDSAFYNCSNLTGVTIPSSVTSIGDWTFGYCSGLTVVKIPSSVTSIGEYAFYNCSSLTEVTIPSSVTSIGDSAFCSYSKLVIYCEKDSYAEKYAIENNISYKYIQTITATDFTKTLGDAAFSLGAATDGDGTLTYESDNPSVAAVDGNGTVTIVGAGTAHITITASETDTYNAAAKTITITVKEPEKKAQTITAKNITKTYGAKAFSLGVKTNGGGKLTYKVADSKVASVSTKGKVTIKGCGKTQIKITAAAKGDYKKTTTTITLTVKPKKVTIASAKSAKSKTVTVKWKADKTAGGYIIQCATDKNFKKNVKTVTVSKNKTVSKNVTKLKGGKTYYVRVCAYTTADGEKIKGSYSKVLTVKVKK